MARQRLQSSLRYSGQASIMIDKPTKSALKQLAGDSPVSHYIRDWAHRELEKQGKGRALPGQERTVSENTIASVKSDTTTLLKAVSLLLTWPLTKEQVSQLEHSPLSFLTDKEIIATGRAIREAIGDKVRSRPSTDNSQAELNLGQ